MNATVTASGMQIKATTGGNLLIANTATASAPLDSDYNTSVTINDASATTLAPASTIDLQKWYKAQAAGVSASTATDGSYELLTNTSGYLLTKYLWLKSADKDGNAYLSGVTVTGVSMGKSSGNVPYFYDSMRIGVFFDATHYVIYVPDVSGYTASAAGYGTVSGTTSVKEYQKVCEMSGSSGSYTAAYDETDNNIGALEAGVGKMATVYIWFEGEDSSCYTNNVNLAEMTIALTFSCSGLGGN